jgi:hypothetical protein
MLVKYQLSILNSGVIIIIDIALYIKINIIKRIAFIREFRFQKRVKNSIFKWYIISGANI